MNREIGFGRKALHILEEEGLTYEHVPSGIDDITIILRHDQMDSELEHRLVTRLKQELQADEVTVRHNLALIMVVGEAMRHNVGTTARASKALSEAKRQHRDDQSGVIGSQHDVRGERRTGKTRGAGAV